MLSGEIRGGESSRRAIAGPASFAGSVSVNWTDLGGVVTVHEDEANSAAARASKLLPRVTLVLFAFNQEEYVGEAIASAFDQDYPNLQIILSDDNSADGTFDLMREAADSYAGPHEVRINRTRGGEGIVQHYLHAIRHADGELVVGVAGDDMSSPRRVSRLVELWQGSGAAGIYSAWNRVDSQGNFLRLEKPPRAEDSDLAAFFPRQKVMVASGATAAFAMDFLRSIEMPRRPIWAEDYFFSALVMLRGQNLLYVNEPLISYRQNPKALSNFSTAGMEFRTFEERDQAFSAKMADILEELLDVAAEAPEVQQRGLDRGQVLRRLAWYRYRAAWPTLGPIQRLSLTLSLRSWRELRWALPRLLGLRAFLGFKKAGRRFVPLSSGGE